MPTSFSPRAAQHAVELRAVLRGLDLARVGGAHGGHDVGRHDALLEQVDAAVELEPFDREVLPAQAQRGQRGAREDALVGEVVDREHRARRRERGGLGHEGLEVAGHEGGGPVVAMHDVDRAAAGDALAHDLGRGPRQDGEAQGVVGVVLAALAVDAGAIEEAGRVDHDEVDLRGEPPVEHRHVERPLSQRELQRREAARQEEPLLFERRVARHDDGDRVPEGPQRLGEGRRDVGQAADFDEGRELGRDEGDVHRSPAYTMDRPPSMPAIRP